MLSGYKSLSSLCLLWLVLGCQYVAVSAATYPITTAVARMEEGQYLTFAQEEHVKETYINLLVEIGSVTPTTLSLQVVDSVLLIKRHVTEFPTSELLEKEQALDFTFDVTDSSGSVSSKSFQPTKKGSGTDLVMIVGIAVGAAVMIALVIAFVVVRRNKDADYRKKPFRGSRISIGPKKSSYYKFDGEDLPGTYKRTKSEPRRSSIFANKVGASQLGIVIEESDKMYDAATPRFSATEEVQATKQKRRSSAWDDNFDFMGPHFKDAHIVVPIDNDALPMPTNEEMEEMEAEMGIGDYEGEQPLELDANNSLEGPLPTVEEMMEMETDVLKPSGMISMDDISDCGGDYLRIQRKSVRRKQDRLALEEEDDDDDDNDQ